MTTRELTERERKLADLIDPLVRAYLDDAAGRAQLLEAAGDAEGARAVNERRAALIEATAAGWEEAVGEPMTMAQALASAFPAGR